MQKNRAVKILDTSRPAYSLLDHSVDEIIDQLREVLSQTEILEAWLFGSLARGQVQAWSDIDLLLVVDTDRPFVERPFLFSSLFDKLPYAIDLLVYTPCEFASLSQSNSGFWRSFRQEKVRIR